MLTMRPFVIAIVLCSSGCSRVWFSQSLRETYRMGLGEQVESGLETDSGERSIPEPVDPGKLQYFVSDRIVLSRVIGSRRDRVARGRIFVRKGQMIERVVIRRGTPGVAVKWGPDWVAVSFEASTMVVFDLAKDSVDQTGFERPPGLTTVGRPDDHYYLRTRKARNGQRQTEFAGRLYVVDKGAGASLKIKRRVKRRYRFRRRVLRGRRLQ